MHSETKVKNRILPVLACALSISFSPQHAVADGQSLDHIKVMPIFDRPAEQKLRTTINGNASALEQAIAWHGLAGMGVEGAARTAIEKFEALDSKDPLSQAYLGSAYIMRARDASFITARVRNARKGLTKLEGAVKAAPNDFRVRTLRAVTTYNLPEIFDYRDEISADLESMLTLIGSSKSAPKRGTKEHGRVLAAAAKERLLKNDVSGAKTLIEQLEANFAENSALMVAAKQLRKLANL